MTAYSYWKIRRLWWTESLAVGDCGWVDQIAGGVVSRTKKIDAITSGYDNNVEEAPASYALKTSLRVLVVID